MRFILICLPLLCAAPALAADNKLKQSAPGDSPLQTQISNEQAAIGASRNFKLCLDQKLGAQGMALLNGIERRYSREIMEKCRDGRMDKAIRAHNKMRDDIFGRRELQGIRPCAADFRADIKERKLSYAMVSSTDGKFLALTDNADRDRFLCY